MRPADVRDRESVTEDPAAVLRITHDMPRLDPDSIYSNIGDTSQLGPSDSPTFLTH